MKFSLSRLPLPFAGLLALAVAMGIGRFAFTPLLPIMQMDAGLSLTQGGWLASANYLGYLLGALLAARLHWPAQNLLRSGLWLVVLSTAAMGLGAGWSVWLLWRFLAGLASAWTFVGASSLCISRLVAAGQAHRNGVVFAGVGCGIAFAGLATTALVALDQSSARIWLWLSGAAWLGLMGASAMWHQAPPAAEPRRLRQTLSARSTTQENHAPEKPGGLHWGLIWCYGVFGFGYILPATFLPAQTREIIANPLVFGLTWPVFGLAAACSTLISGRLERRFSHLQIWTWAQAIMAVGVIVPVLWPHLFALIWAACCVGGTLMVITAAGIQEAQRAVQARMAQQQIAAMTASFALGQLAGPLFFSSFHSLFGVSLDFALVLGTALLLAGLWPLHKLRRALDAAAD